MLIKMVLGGVIIGSSFACAMLPINKDCDIRYLNDRVVAYASAVSSGVAVNLVGLSRDLQFLSGSALSNEEFSKYKNANIEEFNAYCDDNRKVVEIGSTSSFIDSCREIFSSADNLLKKMQAYILMERVLFALNAMIACTSELFVPSVIE
jgi:hypothetical protein